MDMFTLVYASTATSPFKEGDLQKLATFASKRNASDEITGYLFYRHEKFFQYLEGDEARVRALYESIGRDERHEIFREIELGEIDERQFSDWAMRYVTASELAQIELEDVAQDILARMTEPTFTTEAISRHVMNVVQKIAKFRIEIGMAKYS